MKKHIELDHFVDTHDRPFVVIGRDFSVVSVNKAYEKTFQVRREELEGKKCHEILHHRDRPCFEMGEDCPYAQCFMTEAALQLPAYPLRPAGSHPLGAHHALSAARG